MKTNKLSSGIIAGTLMAASLFVRAESESAIGQLEDITGQKIQRPSTISSQPRPSTIQNYKHYTPPKRPQKRPVQRPSNSAMMAFNTGMTILNILDSIDSSQQQAQAQAHAQWLAEQQRIIEEQRQHALRVMTAQRLRSFWDNADSSMSDSLSGALAMPGQGTNFFGSSPQPDPGAMGNILSAPIDLPAVAPPTPPVPDPPPVPPVPNPTSSPPAAGSMPGRVEPMAKPDPSLKEVTQALSRDAVSTVKKYAVKALPIEQADSILEHGEKMDRFIENFFTSMGSERIVRTLSHGSTTDHRRLLQDLRRIDREASLLGFQKSPVDSEGLEMLREWLEQRKLNLKQVSDMVVNGTRQAVVEKQIDRLMWGNQ